MREKEINKIKIETKRKLKMLDDKINNILRNLYVDLAILRLNCEFLRIKPYEYNSIKMERKLRILAKKKRVNKIERLKEEVNPLMPGGNKKVAHT